MTFNKIKTNEKDYATEWYQIAHIDLLLEIISCYFDLYFHKFNNVLLVYTCIKFTTACFIGIFKHIIYKKMIKQFVYENCFRKFNVHFYLCLWEHSINDNLIVWNSIRLQYKVKYIREFLFYQWIKILLYTCSQMLWNSMLNYWAVLIIGLWTFKNCGKYNCLILSLLYNVLFFSNHSIFFRDIKIHNLSIYPLKVFIQQLIEGPIWK